MLLQTGIPISRKVALEKWLKEYGDMLAIFECLIVAPE